MKKIISIIAIIAIPLTYMLSNLFGSDTDDGASSNESVSASSGTAPLKIYGYYPYWKYKTFPVSSIEDGFFDGIFHAFIWPSRSGRLVVPSGFKDKLLTSGLKSKGKKLIVSVGGSNHSSSFENMTDNPGMMKTFISNLKDFINKNEYDGVDIDWEYPIGNNDSETLAAIARDLKQEIPGVIVTTALPLNLSDYRIDISKIQVEYDMISVMAYDLETGMDGYAGMNAPLYKNEKMTEDYSIDHLLQKEYLSKGVPPGKLILGIPLYGRRFNVPEPYTPAEFSETIEFKDMPSSGCIEKSGSYLSCGSYYISFDNSMSIREKIDYSEKKGLNGIFFWAIGQDDNRLVKKINIKKE